MGVWHTEERNSDLEWCRSMFAVGAFENGILKSRMICRQLLPNFNTGKLALAGCEAESFFFS